jgi:hypothetical protein
MLSGRRRFFFFVGREYIDDLRDHAVERMTDPGENIAVTFGPDGGFLQLGHGRLEREDVEGLAIIELADEASQVFVRYNAGRPGLR